MSELSKRMTVYSTAVDKFLKTFIESYTAAPSELTDSMLYSAMAGGKRLRPALLLGTFEALGGGGYEKAIPFAASIEMIHTYSLIHDDLPAMDDDDMRRGKPSNHMVYGEAGAILAGDALLNGAMENLLATISQDSSSENIQAASVIMKAAGADGMIGGQVLDMDGAVGSDMMVRMHTMKTGALIKASVLAGGILAGCTEKDMNALNEYSDALGIAFQIKDDILDVQSTDEVLGKPTGSDARNEKTTYTSVYGVDEAAKMLNAKVAAGLQALDKLDYDFGFLRDMGEFIRDRKD